MIILLHFSALLGNAESWHSSGCYFDTYLNVIADNVACQTTNTLQECFEEHDKGKLIWPENSSDPNLIEHLNIGLIPRPTRPKGCAASVLRDVLCLFLLKKFEFKVFKCMYAKQNKKLQLIE